MKILITGGSGLLGSRIAKMAADTYEIILTYNTKPLFSGSIKMDITNRNEVLQVITRLKPDFVVHTAAETNVDKCEVEKKRVWYVNVRGTSNIAEVCVKNSAKLIFISTDYIFDGKRGLYSEMDKPNPVNFYGLTKLEGEKYVKELCRNYIIVRTSVLYGWHPWKRNFATWVIESLRHGKRIAVVDDHYNSPTLADNLAEALVELARRDLNGVYHIAGNERINRYEFALKIAEVFNLDKCFIEPTKMKELRVWVAKRPRDSSLCTDKAQRELRTIFFNVSEGLYRLKKIEYSAQLSHHR